VAIARHIADEETIAVGEGPWALLAAARLRWVPTGSGTTLDVAVNERCAGKVVNACRRERARRLHAVAPAESAELATTDPGCWWSMTTICAGRWLRRWRRGGAIHAPLPAND
jgi:ESX secretion system protein EccA